MNKNSKGNGITDFAIGNLQTGAHIELYSDREAVVEGIKGIIEYNDCYIKLSGGKYMLEFWGEKLEILTLSISGVVIRGNIKKVEFCR